jgi:hypothetical protein
MKKEFDTVGGFSNLFNGLSRIFGSHGGEYEDGCLLGCSAVKSGKSLPFLGCSAV